MFLDFCFDNFYNKTFDIHLFFLSPDRNDRLGGNLKETG